MEPYVSPQRCSAHKDHNIQSYDLLHCHGSTFGILQPISEPFLQRPRASSFVDFKVFRKQEKKNNIDFNER